MEFELSATGLGGTTPIGRRAWVRRIAGNVAFGAGLVIEQLVVLAAQLAAADFFISQTPALGVQQQEPAAFGTGNWTVSDCRMATARTIRRTQGIIFQEETCETPACAN